MRHSLIFRLLASGGKTFPIESSKFFSVLVSTTSGASERLAGVQGFNEIHVTEHKHFSRFSILKYSNQCTLKQSEDSLKIFCTPKRYEFTRIQELFPSCFFFSRGTTRAPATDELRLDAHEITAKNIISLKIFS